MDLKLESRCLPDRSFPEVEACLALDAVPWATIALQRFALAKGRDSLRVLPGTTAY